MKKLIGVALAMVIVGGVVAHMMETGQRGAVAPPPAPAAAQSAATAAGTLPSPPAFDGNVANIVWGGRVESVTGDEWLDWGPVMLVDPGPGKGYYSTQGGKGPVDIVISFFRREPALIGSVTISSLSQTLGLKDVEVWASPTSATDGFSKLAAGTLPLEPDPFRQAVRTLDFAPVEARFVKIRLMSNHAGSYAFRLAHIQVMEATRPGYVPLVKRHPEIADPPFVTEGTKASAGQAPTTGCAPAQAPPLQPGNGESRKVLLIKSTPVDVFAGYVPFSVKRGRLPRTHTTTSPEMAIFDRVASEFVETRHAQPWMLADYDTVVFEQVCDARLMSPRFTKALIAWVAAGHKLIIHDSDKCGQGSDFRWLPYSIKTNNPGARGAPGWVLRAVENNWMWHTLRGRPGFVDTAAWIAMPGANELGDSNVIVEWGPGWCGHIVTRNANGVFGFVQAYAHHGRGLIIWEGLDVDMVGTKWLDIVRAQQLAQGFNTDNLPCTVTVGGFVVTTEPRLVTRGVQPGQTYTYPLTLLSNLGYKGTVSLSAAPSRNANGVQTRFEPATVQLSGAQESALTLTIPAGTAPPFSVEVKGTATDGKTNSLCLQLGPMRSGELTILSMLAPAAKTRKNLEIILDASGSMKTLLAGKQTRWDVALDTLQQVLNTLPDDFNVGLRMYGHREPSKSPKTCTDSELLVPVRKIDRQATLKRAMAYKPKGETPLVYSVLQAPTDLKPVGGGTVILITDGEESCKGDPVKAAADLKASGMDVRLSIVGFALKDPKTQKDLAGFAQSTGGLYYSAQSGAALADALLAAAIEKFPYTVYDSAGKQVLASEAGSGGDELPAGEYKVVVKAGTRELVAPRVRVALGVTTTLKIALKNGQLVLE